MPDNQVSVLIPAFNEEKRIGKTIMAARSIPEVIQILVVDDGSHDGTAAVALNQGAEVVSLGHNVGKGGAINAGATRLKGDLVLLLDGDLGESASLAASLLEPLRNHTADMTVAVFPKSKKKAGFGLVKGLARNCIKMKTGLLLEAPLSGQRAVRREVLDHCLPMAQGYGVEVDFTIKASLRGYRIKEVPLNMYHRFTERNLSGFIHRGKQFCHVARVLFSTPKTRW